jgi:hypothetical protein
MSKLIAMFLVLLSFNTFAFETELVNEEMINDGYEMQLEKGFNFFSVYAFAQCAPRYCQAHIQNNFARPLFCQVNWRAMLANGMMYFQTTQHFVPMGFFNQAFIYSNFPNPHFIRADVNVWCQFY